MKSTTVRSATTAIVVAAAFALPLTACSSDNFSSDTTTADSEASAITVAPTTAAPTTTSPPTTAPASEPSEGLVWASAASDDRINTDTPQPTFEADGITSQIESVLSVKSGGANDVQQACREEADLEQEFTGGELATECLIVQWAFDISADFRTDEFSVDGGLSARVLVNPQGNQINSFFAASGLPGTVNNRLVVTFAGGVPGSTLRFDTGSNFVGFTTHVYEVPPGEEFLPVLFGRLTPAGPP
jgi:hypothetical protein